MAKILIVDDSFTARGILKRILAENYEIAEAASGSAALETLKSADFDLVLLDLLMPDMDGFAALAAIKAMKPALPVMVVSADIQESTRQRIMAAGAALMVNKPIKKDALTAIVREILERR